MYADGTRPASSKQLDASTRNGSAGIATMNCTQCVELLEDLLRGELPARREAAARSHLAGCQKCRAMHMQHLRVAELNAATLHRPMLTRLAWPRRAWRWLFPHAPASKSNDGASPVRLGLLGRLPMIPQVATGTVMLLIVLAGLWSLPQLTQRRAMSHFAERTERAEDEARPAARVLSEPAPSERAPGEQASANIPPAETATHAASTPGRLNPPPPAAGIEATEQSSGDAHRRSDLEAALVHYHAHEYAQATPLFSRAIVGATNGSELAMTLLYLARSERALGHCERAVNSYSTLVRVHSERAESLAALREGVACYDSMSSPGRAQHLLEQAATNRSLSAAARSLLTQRAGRKSARHAPSLPAPNMGTIQRPATDGGR